MLGIHRTKHPEPRSWGVQFAQGKSSPRLLDKNSLESNPLKCTFLLGGLAVEKRVVLTLEGTDSPLNLIRSGEIHPL